jgi:hypothetical protein
MAREADGGETGRGEGGVDNRFLYDGPFEPPLYRIKRAPLDKILALRASRAAVLACCARRKFEVAMERAGRSVKKLDRSGRRMVESEDDDSSEVRVNSRRIAEILAPHRREFAAMDPDEQERFMEAIRLFAAGRIKLSEWLAVARAARERFEATLPAPIPPGRAIRAKDRPSVPPQGW